jgi:hypothetical protein
LQKPKNQEQVGVATTIDGAANDEDMQKEKSNQPDTTSDDGGGP